MKKLFTLLMCLLFVGVGNTFAAEDYDLPLDSNSLNSNWGATYDESTHTITLTSDWGGLGWWLGDVDEDDYAGVEIVVTTKQANWVQVLIQYTTSDNSSSAGVTGIGDGTTEQTIYCALDKENDHDVSQIVIQGTSTGDEITIVSAKLVAEQHLADITLPIANDSDLNSGYSSSYDGATHTITFESAWAGRGWWLGSADYTGYEGVEVKFTSALTCYVQLIVQYNYKEKDDDTNTYSETAGITCSGDASEEQVLYFDFSNMTYPYMIDSIEQIYIQSADAGSITLVSATVIAPEDEDEPEPDTGEMDYELPLDTYNGWNATYDTDTHTMTIGTDGYGYGAFQWWYGDADDDDYDGVEIIFTTPQSSDVVLSIQYTSESGTTETAEITSTIGDGTTQERLYLAFNKELDHDVYQIYVQMNGQVNDAITFVSAKLLAPAYLDMPISDSGTYATYYDSQAYTMPDGLVGYTATGVKNGVLTLVESYKGGDTVPMGVALLIQGEVSEYTAKVDHENPTAEVENMFYGSDEEVQTYGPDSSVNYLYYMLSYDTDGENLGFYWGADNGGAFTSAAHKAWLAVPEAEGANLSSIAIKKGGEDTTGISEVSVANEVNDGVVYDIAGRRVSTPTKGGVYIMNGKKFIVK